MNNAEKFKEIFKEFATEVWAFPEKDFLTWLNAEYEEPTIRNCFGCKYSKDNHNSGTEECHLCMWENQYTPTTKNDLGVDCISREQALNEFCIYNPYDSIGVDKVRSYLKALPSVTPQEPRKGEWLRMSDLSEQEDDRYKCSCCGNVVHHKNEMALYTFNSWCGRCGSDNGRHINYEVEE